MGEVGGWVDALPTTYRLINALMCCDVDELEE